MPAKDQEVQDQKVNRRNIIIVKINSQDRLFAGNEPIDVSDPKLPEKEMKDIEGFGQYPVSKGVISLQNDRGTSYQAYIAVQNEIVRAINEIREDFCRANYGKAYENLTEEQQEIVREAVPQLISEAEPKDVSQN